MFGEYQNVYKSEDQKDGFHLFLFWQNIDPRQRNWQDARECTRKWTPHNFLAYTFFSFQQKCFILIWALFCHSEIG